MAAIVNKGDADPQAFSVLVAVHMVQDIVQRFPGLRESRIAHQLTAPDAPAFITLAPADHLILKAVILYVYAAGEDQNTVRKLGSVRLPPCHHLVFRLQIAAILPQLAEQCVVFDLQALRIVLRFEEFLHDRKPALPRTDKSIQPE